MGWNCSKSKLCFLNWKSRNIWNSLNCIASTCLTVPVNKVQKYYCNFSYGHSLYHQPEEDDGSEQQPEFLSIGSERAVFTPYGSKFFVRDQIPRKLSLWIKISFFSLDFWGPFETQQSMKIPSNLGHIQGLGRIVDHGVGIQGWKSTKREALEFCLCSDTSVHNCLCTEPAWSWQRLKHLLSTKESGQDRTELKHGSCSCSISCPSVCLSTNGGRILGKGV